VLILKELHDKLDALVFEAYGWPVDLTDEQILEKLVALNKERAAEEKAGTVRWLRPDYQIPRFGSDAERARLAEEKRQQREAKRATQGVLFLDDDLQEMKPRFPTGNE
jgi:chaperone required for assembly of F1-ATPase